MSKITSFCGIIVIMGIFYSFAVWIPYDWLVTFGDFSDCPWHLSAMAIVLGVLLSGVFFLQCQERVSLGKE